MHRNKMTYTKSLYRLRLEFKMLDNYISFINPAFWALKNPCGFNFEGSLRTMPCLNSPVLCGGQLLTTNRHVRWDHFQTGYSLTTICCIYSNKLFTLRQKERTAYMLDGFRCPVPTVVSLSSCYRLELHDVINSFHETIWKKWKKWSNFLMGKQRKRK